MESTIDMSLPAGKRLGHFEIVEAIGAGGMGQVYRARDTRLGRDVAIKILPPELAATPGFRERFEREARTISSLDHPNICVLHDIGHDEGLDYLVMEYLRGESLAERLQKGPLPVGDLLGLASQVADALDKAHRAGLVHRDLKPGNIMVTPSGAKLLDFGVAKSMGVAGDAGGLTSTPTLASPLTAAGAIVGTFQYMAPELFQGHEADARSDIFAFGTVLYEMATGHRAFEGNTQAMVIASILKDTPRRLVEMVPGLPRGVARLIDACLAKDPEQRRQSVHDLKLELDALVEDTAAGLGPATAHGVTVTGPGTATGVQGWPPTGPGAPPGDAVSGVFPTTTAATSRPGASGLWVVTTVLLAVATAAFAAWTLLRPVPPARVVRASMLPPADSSFVVTGIGVGAVVLSPDGARVAFTASHEGGNQLWVRSLDALEAVPLPGTDGAYRPFWSPDSKFIGFFAAGKLKKISAEGGPPLVLADAADGRGGSWNDDGVIIYTPDYLGPVYRVSAGAGETVPATAGRESTTFTHRYAHFLPDGNHFLFLDRGATAGSGESPTIRVGSLSDGASEGKPLLEVASNIAYHDGHLLYVRDGTLLAQSFDVRALKITGDPVVVASDVVFDLSFSCGAFSVSKNGILSYHSGQALSYSQFTWFDREGNELGRVDEPGQYDGPALSPDGRMLAATRTNSESGKGDIWVYDLERGTKSRLSFDEGDDFLPLWTPDGTHVTFASARQHGYQPFTKSADGSGVDESVFELDGDVWPFDWTPDGRTLLFASASTSTSAARQTTLSMAADGEVTPLWDIPSQGVGQLSTDGKWIAYVSDESGRNEVFLGLFPEAAAKWQVSTGGGTQPRWRADGKEIYYRSPDGRFMAAEISLTGRRVAVGTVRPLFQVSAESLWWSYDVAPDGQRFIVNVPLTENNPQPVTLVLNWTAELDN